jgi:uncharacterized membrane protein
MSLPIFTSQVTGIMGINHYTQPNTFNTIMKKNYSTAKICSAVGLNIICAILILFPKLSSGPHPNSAAQSV